MIIKRVIEIYRRISVTDIRGVNPRSNGSVRARLARESERHVLGAISVARPDDTRLTRRIFTSEEISELAMTRPDLSGNA